MAVTYVTNWWVIRNNVQFLPGTGLLPKVYALRSLVLEEMNSDADTFAKMCRSYIATSITKWMRVAGLCTKKRNILTKALQETVEKASHWIWVKREDTSWSEWWLTKKTPQFWIWIWIYTSQKPINGYKRDGTGRAHQLFLYRSPLLLKSSMFIKIVLGGHYNHV